MPRRNQHRRRRTSGEPTADPGHGPQIDSGPDGEWAYRTVPTERAAKVYRCPGCDQAIAVGVRHVVAWRTDDGSGVADRRHWHNGCWSARRRRGPTRRWS